MWFLQTTSSFQGHSTYQFPRIIALFSALMYLNFKLFKISREVRRRKEKSPEKRTKISLKSISTCLLVVACLVILSISSGVYFIFNINTENRQTSNAILYLAFGGQQHSLWTVHSTVWYFSGRTNFYARENKGTKCTKRSSCFEVHYKMVCLLSNDVIKIQ